MLFSGDEVYDDETTSGPISPLDRDCDHCGALEGEPCAPTCPDVWRPPTVTRHDPGPGEAREETQRVRRGHDFFPTAALPRFYATEDTPCEDKILYAHFFCAPVGDWWIAEYRPETAEAFGYVSLGIPGCAEWGYIALDELERLRTCAGNVVERDLHWTPTRAGDAKLPR